MAVAGDAGDVVSDTVVVSGTDDDDDPADDGWSDDGFDSDDSILYASAIS